MRGELIISVRGGRCRQASQHAIPQPFALVGSSDDCNVRLPADDLNGRVLLLCAIGDQVVPIEFYGSARRDGEAASPGNGPVMDWAEGVASGLRIGSSIVDAVWVGSDGRISKLGEPVSLTQNVTNQGLGFRFLNAFSRRKREQVRHLRERVTLIGRTSPCHLKLADPRIPKVQCTVTRIGGRVALNNLGSDGLLKLNGDEVDSAYLSEGDELAIGTFRMQFWCAEPDLLHVEEGREWEVLAPQGPMELQAVLMGLTSALGAGGLARVRKDDLTDLGSGSAEQVRGAADWSIASTFERLVATQQLLVAEAQKQTQLFENLVSMLAQNHRETVQRDLKRSEMIAGEIQQLRRQLPMGMPAPGMLGMVPSLPPEAGADGGGAHPERFEAGERIRRSADTRIHSAIEEKIHALEAERRSCLKRVLRLIAGKDL